MRTVANASPFFGPQVWEDLVHDFLETGCALNEKERRSLVEQLREQEPNSEEIDAHAGFSIGNCVVVICDDRTARECWIYNPKAGKVQKFVRKD